MIISTMIYVDRAYTWSSRHAPEDLRIVAFRGHTRCYCWATSTDELHRFARRLGVRRRWFSPRGWTPHYELTPALRAKAIELGARERSLYTWRHYQLLLAI